MASPGIKKRILKIDGMTCVSCAAGLLHLFGGPLMNPVIAAAAMALSSVSVLTNALQLKRFKPYHK